MENPRVIPEEPLYVAFHLNPAHLPIRLMWAALAVMWLVFLYPGYRWWRAKRIEVEATNESG
jgi:hypothetical protein